MNNENRGFLYPVKEKKSEKSPNMTGKIFITPDLAGREVEIAGWTQVSKAGNKYISLSVKEPYVAEQSQQQQANQAQNNFNQPAQTQTADTFNDDIPF